MNKITIFASTTLLAACVAMPPPIDRAILRTIRLATPEDVARAELAEIEYRRENFGSVSFTETNGERFTFTDYDMLQQYLRANPSSRMSHLEDGGPRWPLLYIRVTLPTTTADYDESSMDQLELEFCDHMIEDDLVPPESALLNGRYVWGLRTLHQDQPEFDYEILTKYTHLQSRSPGLTEHAIAAPPGDLCLFVENTGFHRPKAGIPLRIDRGLVAAALGPMPQPLMYACPGGEVRASC